jgi:hypothetical protein
MQIIHPSTTGRRPASTPEPLVVSPREAWRMLNCGNTHGYALLARNELQSYLDGRKRKIVVASVHRLIARRLASTGATDDQQQQSPPQPRRRERRPKTRAAAARNTS